METEEHSWTKMEVTKCQVEMEQDRWDRVHAQEGALVSAAGTACQGMRIVEPFMDLAAARPFARVVAEATGTGITLPVFRDG